MGKGKKNILLLVRDKKFGGDAKSEGCNSPAGCLLHDDPPADCSRNPDFVKVICNSEKCPRNQYLHRQCYENWEDKVIMGVQKSQARTRDWTDDQVRRLMWTRIWDVAYRHCKCVCGGYLKKADALEPVAQAAGDAQEPKKKKAAKSTANSPKSQPLPKLNQPPRNTYTYKSTHAGTLAAGSNRNAGTPSKFWHLANQSKASSLESLNTAESAGDHYIPGLSMAKEKAEPRKQRRSSTLSDEACGQDCGNVASSPPVSAPTTPTEQQDEDGWRVVGARGRKEPRGAASSDAEFQNRRTATTSSSLDNEDEPSTSAVVNVDNFDPLVFYKAKLTVHSRLTDPNVASVYDRDLFEIKCVLDEMNEAVGL